METSDSEYFESADEDFDSDYEKRNVKLKQYEEQIPIAKPELCTSKLTEESITKDNSEGGLKCNPNVIKNDTPNCKVGNKDSINLFSPNKQYGSDQQRSKQELDIKKNYDKIGDIEINNLSGTEQTLGDVPEKIENIKLTSEVESVANQKGNLPIPKIANLEPKENQHNDLLNTEEEEENLWDVDEIDWESEAVKEECQKTDRIIETKNEDNGWDDFDVDWESETLQTEVDETTPNIEIHSRNSSVPLKTKEKIVEEHKGSVALEQLENKSKQNEVNESNWGGWGHWGVSSILSTATQSVSTLTSHVSQGFSAVFDGIPDPEEMAKLNKFEKEKQVFDKEQVAEENTQVKFGLGNLVSGVSHLTKFVESTGTKVIAGSLDTLEAIGKKTVEVLQEGDPGLKKKRAFLKLENGKPNLSQILREAKEQAEEKSLQQKHTQVKRIKNYEALFDDHQGLVHLEALEMLSKLCTIKLENLKNSLTGKVLQEMHETLEQVKELCELPEDEEEEKISLEDAKEVITNAVAEIHIPITYNQLFSTCEETDHWLKSINLSFIDVTELHQQAIEALAHITAIAVEQFHKAGELLLVKDHRSTADEADSLVQITTTLKSIILCEASKFTEKLGCFQHTDKESINENITNIFYEAANSGSYIENAFQLLIPVLQVGAV